MWVSFLITDSLQHRLLCDALRVILRPREILNQSLITSRCFVCLEELSSAKTKPRGNCSNQSRSNDFPLKNVMYGLVLLTSAQINSSGKRNCLFEKQQGAPSRSKKTAAAITSEMREKEWDAELQGQSKALLPPPSKRKYHTPSSFQYRSQVL